MQNYLRQYSYYEDFWSVYDFYSKHGIPFLVTYYNIDIEETVWDNENLMGGYYEKIGSLSGIKWKKILTFPVYFIQETDTIFDAQEKGYVNEGATGFTIPSSYNIIPYPNDIIVLYQNYLNDNYKAELYSVTAVQKESPLDRQIFWKCGCKVEQSLSVDNIDLQVSENLIFYDYDKKIHSIEDATTMTKILQKNENIKTNLNNIFDQNSGLYFI